MKASSWSTLGLLGIGSAVIVACSPIHSTEVPNPNKSNDTAPAEDPEGRPMPTGNGQGGPAVNEGSAKSHDVYDKENTDVVLARAARSVQANCGASADDEGKAKGPWGKVTINVMLGHNGRTKDVSVPEPYAATPSGKCIVQAFSGLTFPPWNGQDTQVPWEVELVKPADTGTSAKPAGKKK